MVFAAPAIDQVFPGKDDLRQTIAIEVMDDQRINVGGPLGGVISWCKMS